MRLFIFLLLFASSAWGQASPPLRLEKTIELPDGLCAGTLASRTPCSLLRSTGRAEVTRQSRARPEFHSPTSSDSWSKRIRPFHCEAGLTDLRGVRGSDASELRSNVVNDVEIAVGPVVIPQADVGADGLGI